MLSRSICILCMQAHNVQFERPWLALQWQGLMQDMLWHACMQHYRRYLCAAHMPCKKIRACKGYKYKSHQLLPSSLGCPQQGLS
jgi:hypothetical protein